MHRINLPQIAHETIDKEVFIINTVNGMYYTAQGYAAIIWNAIAAGYSLDQIVHAFEASQLFDSKEKIVENFFLVLLEEGLIVKAESASAENLSPLQIEKITDQKAPILSKYDDLQEIVALDPIHDVSVSMGWPFQK